MNNMDIESYDTESLIEQFAHLKQNISDYSELASKCEAELIKRSEKLLNNTKYKSIIMHGEKHNLTVTTSNTLCIVYPSRLNAIFGNAYHDIVTTETKYKINTYGTRLLTAIVNGEYSKNTSLQGLIETLNVADEAKKLLSKKLKGINFDKDKTLLMNVCGFDEETASDYAYMAAEAVNWENLINLIKLNTGDATPVIIEKAIKTIKEVAVVSQNVKVTLI